MQPTTFACSHCNNLMAVGPELLGQPVRCPTCGGVVQAPSAPPAYVLEPAPVQPPGVLPPDDVPEIRVQAPIESPESIFGEDHGEDVFGSPSPKIELPPEIAAPSPNGSSHTGFAPYPPPDSLTVAPPVDAQLTIESAPPPFELVPLPSAAPEAMPKFEAPPEPAWQPVAQEPAWQPVESPPMIDAAMDDVPVALPRAQTQERKKQSLTAVTFLAPYALISTLLAGWFGYQYYDLRSKHPLENIPDIIGDNDPAKRSPLKQTSERTLKLPSPDQPLPDKLKVPLGQTLRIGDLEVSPLKIEEGRFQFTVVYENGATEVKTSPHPGLILRVRLRNVSADVVFCPTDPFFDRQYIPDVHRSRPYTFLEVGEQRFYGGPFNYLGFHRDAKNPRKRVFAEGQDNNYAPLQPGEERETRFYTFPDSDGELLSAVHSFKDTLTWRLQLRRGLMSFKNREYSMCAVVGVQFNAADIHRAN